MKTQTGYYGETEYNPSDLVVVAEGFFGFPELKQFLPLRLDEDNGEYESFSVNSY